MRTDHRLPITDYEIDSRNIFMFVLVSNANRLPTTDYRPPTTYFLLLYLPDLLHGHFFFIEGFAGDGAVDAKFRKIS